ncbi:MAG: hypothetical protein KF716_11395 [Anaerolineae bacterium]|nr:hypothetical protein [Anaerolineae bacterium]
MNTQNQEIQQLEISLSLLASRWRGSFNEPEIQDELVQEYRKTVQRLYELGWDDVIGIESQLPEEFMPMDYVQRNPAFYSPTINMTWKTKDPNEMDWSWQILRCLRFPHFLCLFLIFAFLCNLRRIEASMIAFFAIWLVALIWITWREFTRDRP